MRPWKSFLCSLKRLFALIAWHRGHVANCILFFFNSKSVLCDRLQRKKKKNPPCAIPQISGTPSLSCHSAVITLILPLEQWAHSGGCSPHLASCPSRRRRQRLAAAPPRAGWGSLCSPPPAFCGGRGCPSWVKSCWRGVWLSQWDSPVLSGVRLVTNA